MQMDPQLMVSMGLAAGLPTDGLPPQGPAEAELLAPDSSTRLAEDPASPSTPLSPWKLNAAFVGSPSGTIGKAVGHAEVHSPTSPISAAVLSIASQSSQDVKDDGASASRRLANPQIELILLSGRRTMLLTIKYYPPRHHHFVPH